MRNSLRISIAKLLAAQAAVSVLVPANAQGLPEASQPAGPAAALALAEVVVTGSRIRRDETETSAPLLIVDQQVLTDRGLVSAPQVINQVTSATPQLSLANGGGGPAGSGQQYASLFGLGPGRTLTLLNGRRMVTSSTGLGDSQVDGNIIPVGLLERVEIVQAGGAAVYGSDAIAGVVNYVLRKDFDGLEADLQTGNASRGDYATHSARVTWGLNFAEDRGNVALNLEWSESPTLDFDARRLGKLSRITGPNSADTGPNDGIPSIREILNAHFWPFSANGVVFSLPAPLPNFLTRVNGSPVQFGANGDLVPFDIGTFVSIPFAEGGDGFRLSDLVPYLRTGVERKVANAVASFDLTDNLALSAELLYANTEGTDALQVRNRTVLNSVASGAGPLPFTSSNPFLSPATIAALSAASPSFAAGGPLFLSRILPDILPSPDRLTETETMRALLGIDGEFDVGQRNYYWSVSGSYARVDGSERRWDVDNALFSRALAAVRSTDGSPVCSVNADADPANDDPSCVALNPFGVGNISDASRDYVAIIVGNDYENRQTDLLATLGGSLATLPAGDLKFSLAYEHRREEAQFTPLLPNQQGSFGTGVPELPQSGKYHTNEIAVELVAPLLGGDLSLPMVDALEFNGAYRYVDNSAAGTEDVWNLGLRWVVTDGVTLRASRSRNFRAPTLTQLLAPSRTVLGNITTDPCDADRINGGPNPEVRRANCEAEFAANPQYGPLESFQDPAENFTRTLITTGGNPELRNEIARNTSFGVVLQPVFVPGLTLVVDWVEIDLTDGLSAFTVADFLATCYDSSPQPADICATFTRLPQADGLNPAGMVDTGRSTTFNAGVIRYRGEVYSLNYAFGLGDESQYGFMDLGVEATHNAQLKTSVTGTTFTRSDDTIQQPSWIARFDANWSRGPLRVSYQLNYLPEADFAPNVTIESVPTPVISSNITHDLSAQYDFGKLQVRGGVVNLTDKEPSYPTFTYGDIIGRQWFAGVRYRF